jgi:hypothetical protein
MEDPEKTPWLRASTAKLANLVPGEQHDWLLGAVLSVQESCLCARVVLDDKGDLRVSGDMPIPHPSASQVMHLLGSAQMLACRVQELLAQEAGERPEFGLDWQDGTSGD